MTIILYDIPFQVSNAGWSPNTLKTRIALNYKGLEFKTEWLEYPDIEPAMKKIGAKPTAKKADGSGRDHYTLPVIHDTKTGKVVSDSLNIALYLDQTYPDKPLLFPWNSQAAVATYEHVFMSRVFTPSRQFMLPLTCLTLNPPSQEYFRTTREAWYQPKLEEWCPVGPKRVTAWKEIKEGLGLLAGFLDKNTKGSYFFGETLSYGDIIIAGNLAWVKLMVSADEWAALASWDGGRWSKLVEDTHLYASR